MFKIKYIPFLVLTVFIGHDVWSQDILTPEQALINALENNLNIKVARNKVQKAENSATAGNAGLLPTVDFSASGVYNNQSTETELADGRELGGTNVWSTQYNAGVSLDYIIFNGGINRSTLEQLRLQQGLSELQARLQLEQIAHQVLVGYTALATMQQAVEIARQNLSVSQDR